jgi:hypothetical protein
VLGQHDLPLAIAGAEPPEDTVGAVWDTRLHGAADDLTDEERLVDRADIRDPVDVESPLDLDLVPVGEVPGCGAK